MRLILLCCAVLLVGCEASRGQPPPETTAPAAATTEETDAQVSAQDSAWGGIITLDEAAQADAPALLARDEEVLGAWVSMDNRDVYHTVGRATFVRAIRETHRLSILTYFPHEHMLLPATGGRSQVLWLDADPDAPEDGLRLWGLLLDSAELIERGAYILSEEKTYHYDAHRTDDGTAWIAYSAAPAAEPTLRARGLDALGRPRDSQIIRYGADWPSFSADSNGGIRLTWLGMPSRRLMTGTFNDGTLENVTRLVSTPAMDAGDRLAHFSTASHTSDAGTTLYAFWVVVRADGDAETWFTSGSTGDTTTWTDAAPIRVQGITAGWSSALRQPDAPPRLAAQVADALGIITLSNSAVSAFTPVVKLASPGLVGQPTLAQADDGTLYLGWSQPIDGDRAALRITADR